MLNEPKIVFHHIPKCGGMSITAGLALTYYPLRLALGGRRNFPGRLDAKAASAAAALQGQNRYEYRRLLMAYHLEQDKTPFLFGHYPFCPSAYERFKNDWAFVTLLRDPVKRWYSEYYWNRYKSHDYDKTELDIEAYLDSEQGRLNAQSFTNFLAPRPDPLAPPTAKDVKHSLENLEKFDVVGKLEDLPKFRSAMKTRFGRKPFFYKRNSSPAPDTAKTLPDKHSAFHKTLQERLQADIEIYTRAPFTL